MSANIYSSSCNRLFGNRDRTWLFHKRQYLADELLFRIGRIDIEDILVVRLDGNALRASAETEARFKLDLVADAVLFYKRLERLDNVVRPLEVAGTADAYAKCHNFLLAANAAYVFVRSAPRSIIRFI